MERLHLCALFVGPLGQPVGHCVTYDDEPGELLKKQDNPYFHFNSQVTFLWTTEFSSTYI